MRRRFSLPSDGTDATENGSMLAKVNTPALLTLNQVGEQLGCSETTVRTLIRRGELESLHRGRHHRVRPERLAEYVERLESEKRHAERQPASIYEVVKAAGRNTKQGNHV